MKIQVLVAAVGQTDRSLPQKMNIQTDVIVANQCDENSVEQFEWNGHNVKYLNFAERGVGLNRNNALMRADADICLFADDDMVYVDGYCETLERLFSENPTADVIIFNIKEKQVSRYVIPKKMKVGYLNYLRYGTARVAVRLSSVKKNGIYFNQCFGGGTEHCHGEDNIFINNCLKKGLKVIAVPDFLAELTEERESSWNKGYDEKYIRDQGVLYRTLSRKWWRLLCLQDSLRRHGSYNMSFYKAFKLMTESARNK